MTTPHSEVTEVQRIPIDKIRPSPCQMRSSMDPEALERLAESLSQDGQQRPVKVRPLPDEYFELVFGHRTVDAAKIAGMQMVQAIVEDLTDEEVMWAQYAENEYREDISDYDRAKWLRSMIDKFDHSQGEIGEKAGLSRNRVNQLLRILELKGVTAVTLSKLTERQARAILQAPEEDQPSLVNFVELYLEEKGELLPASAIEDYARQLAVATEIGKSRRRFLYEIEGEPAPYEGPTEESTEEVNQAFIEEHNLSWVFDAEANGNDAGFLTKIATLTNEELEFCLNHERRPLNLRRLNEEMTRRDPERVRKRVLLKQPPVTSEHVIAFITEIMGTPAEDLQGKLMEAHGLSEEEAQAALQAYRETYPDIWERCYAEKSEDEEEPVLTVEQYVVDVLHHNPEVKVADLVKAVVELYDVSEAYARGLIDREGPKRRDLYATRSPTLAFCPLCGRANADKNKILMVLEEYEAQPGVSVVAWLKEVLE